MGEGIFKSSIDRAQYATCLVNRLENLNQDTGHEWLSELSELRSRGMCERSGSSGAAAAQPCGRTVGPEDPTKGQLGNLVPMWGDWEAATL